MNRLACNTTSRTSWSRSSSATRPTSTSPRASRRCSASGARSRRSTGCPGSRRPTRARSSTRSSTTSSGRSSRPRTSSTSRTRCRARAASASTPTSSAASVSAAFRLIPSETLPIEELGLPPVIARLRQQAARPRARHGPDRLGQVDHARVDDRRDQRDPRGAHPHHRGPDRVPARAQEVHRQPARARHGRPVLRPRASRPPCARTPTSSSSARCATSRRSGPRSPRRRPATSSSPRCTRRTRRRRSTASSTSSRPTSRARSACSSRSRLQGIVTQQLLPDRRRRGPLLRGRGHDPDARRAQPHPRGQDPPDLLRAADRRQHGMQTMDASLAGLVRQGEITCKLAESGPRTRPSSAACRVRARRAAARRPVRGDGGRLMSATTFAFKAIDLTGVPQKGRGRGARQAGRHRPAQGPRPDRLDVIEVKAGSCRSSCA